MKKALRLNPKLQPYNLPTLALSHIFVRHYEEVLKVINKMQEHASKGTVPGWFPQIEYSFVYQELGREEDARAHMAEVLKFAPLSLESIKKMNTTSRLVGS